MMIQELRIGNYIQLYRHAEDSYKSIHKIKGFFFEDTLNDYAVELEDGFIVGVKGFRDIPLTEDILLKCGEDNEHLMVDKLGFVIFKNGYPYQFVRDDYKHLHSLQNLYHSLRGEELNVEL